MKRKYYILGTLALLCLLGTGYYAWTLYDAHCKQVAEWNEGAKDAFEEALWMEVNKRAETPIYHYSHEQSDMKTLNSIIPDTVRVMTPGGFLKYKIERRKYDLSLIKDTEKRALLGALLDTYPFSINTLMIQWDSLLTDRQIPGRGQIRYIYTDWELRNDTVCVPFDEKMVRSDSLITRYLGFRCEHELVAFVSYPYWLLNLSCNAMGGLLIPGALFVIFLVLYTPLESFIQRRLVKVEIMEKEIHVANISVDKAKIYHLPDGSWFEASECTLKKGELTHLLPPQSALLLKLFLRKEDLYLSHAEIDEGLWNGKGTIDNIHKVIQRLRAELRKASSDLNIKNVNGGYELK